MAGGIKRLLLLHAVIHIDITFELVGAWAGEFYVKLHTSSQAKNDNPNKPIHYCQEFNQLVIMLTNMYGCCVDNTSYLLKCI